MKKTVHLLSFLCALLAAVSAALTNPEFIQDPIFEEMFLDDAYSDVGGDTDSHDAHDMSSSVRAEDDVKTQPLTRRPPGAKYDEGGDEGKGAAISNNDPSPPLCKCRALQRNKNAVCYDMVTPLKSYGHCVKRKCGTQYECIPGGGKGLQNCIRRVATHVTKLKRGEKGTLFCNTDKLATPTVFYNLYT